MNNYADILLPADKEPWDHPRYWDLYTGMTEGRLEVSCPWWAKNHWEAKTSGELFEGCTYRLYTHKKDI
jgi:hypothetical protein